jgi:ABC-type uncharacterized transport system ATPase component
MHDPIGTLSGGQRQALTAHGRFAEIRRDERLDASAAELLREEYV